jgi:hypothetical protein
MPNRPHTSTGTGFHRHVRMLAAAAVLVTGLAMPRGADAGLIPWLYDSIFGYGPCHGFGYPQPYAPPMWSPQPGFAPGPMTSFYGPVATGYGNPCPDPCDPCGIGTFQSGGESDTRYFPPTDDRGDEPTEATPPEPEDRTPRTFDEPETDDFTPATPRERDTPPPARDESDEVLPEPFRRPAPADPSGTDRPEAGEPRPLSPLDSDPESGTEDEVLPSTSPAPSDGGRGGEPGAEEDEVLPSISPDDVQIDPLDMESSPVARIQPNRRRIAVTAGYRIPTVARVQLTPSEPQPIHFDPPAQLTDARRK